MPCRCAAWTQAEGGVQGGGKAPLVGSGAKTQKPAIICTYNNQLYNGNCCSFTQLSILHFVGNLM